MRKYTYLYVVVLIALMASTLNAFTVPQEDSKIEYFYVTGPGGDPMRGAEDHVQVLYIDVPGDITDPLEISVYDPDTGGKIDAKPSHRNKWDTTTEIAIYGSKLLDQKQFGNEGYDKEYYVFGPYDKTDGEPVGNYFRFAIEVKATEGDDANLFNVSILPNSAKVFSTNISFRLLPGKGADMYFYPRVANGESTITVENYDLDHNGGVGHLHDTLNDEEYRIEDSLSGEWKDTTINLSSTQDRYLQYHIVKGRQKNAHAALRIKDSNGNLLPIYFRPETLVAPVVEGARPCNEFTFDATKSFDPDNQALTFLWDFGDGTTSTDPIVTHTFPSGGMYNVMLTVSDNSGLECHHSVAAQPVDVNSPPVASLYAPDIACTDQTVVFDASGTTDNTIGQVTYSWNFGDGTTAEGQSITKTFTKGGTYNVQLMVDDNAGTTCSHDGTSKTIKINTPPVANAGEDIDLCLPANASYDVSFSGAGSTDADGDELTYSWDFGDGTTGDGANASHLYSMSGQYTVKLVVNDNSGSPCSISTDDLLVNLNKNPIAVAGDNQSICTGNEAIFDGTGSSFEPGDSISYNWDFGDGSTGQGPTVSHVYVQGGNYKVTLTVDDGKGTRCSVSADSLNVSVNSLPSAIISAIDTACTGETLTFDASGSSDADGDALTYSWDFGDGTTGDGATVSHAYNQGGNYPVLLTVSDGKGTQCSTVTYNVVASVNAPPAIIVAPIDVVCTGDTVMFDASGTSDADGDTLTYSWDFGDGTTGDGATVSHAYSQGGNYSAVLTVDDGKGTRCSVGSRRIPVSVNTIPSAIISAIDTACTGQTLTFDASGSSDADGDSLIYSWDFGDGTTGDGATVSHAYSQGGNYPVLLTVNDGKGTPCSVVTYNVVASVNTPPAVVVAPIDVVCTGDTVMFDASSTSDADGDTLAYSWDFGDGGTGDGATVSYAYSQGGTYKAVLTVNDGKGTRCSITSRSIPVEVNTQPSAVLSSIDTVCTGEEVAFDGSGSGDVDGDALTYTWDYGDGTVIQGGPNASHSYNSGGNYVVTLKTDDNKGTACSTSTTAINVKVNTPPIADAGPNLVCCLEEESIFDGSGSSDADGDALTYTWNFGDGTTGEGARVTHVYHESGTFTVTLTVNDNSGTKCSTAVDSFRASVNARPTAIIKFQ